MIYPEIVTEVGLAFMFLGLWPEYGNKQEAALSHDNIKSICILAKADWMVAHSPGGQSVVRAQMEMDSRGDATSR
jgi:hypothetical protein